LNTTLFVRSGTTPFAHAWRQHSTDSGSYFFTNPKSDGSYTLGIDLELETNMGELVFNTSREACKYAKQQGWIIVNEQECREHI
jgi:hypothetical protein